MGFRYYNAERIRYNMPQYKGTDQELQDRIDEISLKYNAAIKELNTKLEILSEDFEKKHSHMPIHHVASRLKSFESIIDKAERYEIEDPINNLDQVMKEIYDIAGIRVVCNYEEDIYVMSGLLLDQSDIELLRVKDYCKNPKESGYRSLHVVVALPVYLVNSKAMVPVEIQFRSIIMDTWASLEHELKYKNKGELSESISEELKSCARELQQIDENMSRMRHEVLREDDAYGTY